MLNESKQRIEDFREEIINKTLLVSCFIAIFTYLISLFQLTNSGFEFSFITDLLVVIAISIVTYFRKRFNIRLKSTIILVGIYVVVMVDLFEIGILSANKVLLILIPFFAFISLSAKRSLVYVFMTSGSLLVLAYLHISGILKPIPYKELGIVAWSINLLLILMVAYFIVYIVIKFNEEYEKLIDDLTHQNQLLHAKEKKLARYRDELEEIVTQRTEELNKGNKALKKQKKRLAEMVENLHKTKEDLVQTEKNAALSSLSSGLAHELNNPLNFIKGGVEVLDIYVEKHFSSDLTNEVQKLLNGIKEGVSRSTKIVEGLNHYSSVVNNIESCNINDILSNSIEMLQNQIGNRIAIIKNLDPELPELEGDKYQFYQLFLNLIQNSIDSIQISGIITLSSSYSNGNISININDTGSGVSKKKMKRLFDPFYTTKEVGKGTGLGLHICSAIVKNHGGNLHFESEEHIGTTVVITFPVSLRHALIQ